VPVLPCNRTWYAWDRSDAGSINAQKQTATARCSHSLIDFGLGCSEAVALNLADIQQAISCCIRILVDRGDRTGAMNYPKSNRLLKTVKLSGP
jgi:hypothetical protein